jgi:predicted dehydrogenase
MNTSPIRLGILGAAAIVPNAVTGPARSVPEVQVMAIAARNPERVRRFARRHHIPRVHESYSSLLADPEIDAVYNPLPNSLHAEWTMRALRAGKHVLCEKPFASNAREAVEMAKAAEKSGKVLSEGFAYRYHPLAMRMKDVIASGELGKIKHIEARPCFLLPTPSNIRYQYELAGGALMDTGCYPISLMRFLAGTEPTATQAKARLFKPQVDSRIEADLSFPNDIQARIVCDMLSPKMLETFVRVTGDAGKMKVINPFHPHWFNLMTVRTPQGTHREYIKGGNIYALQLQAFAKAIRGEMTLSTGPDDAVNNMRVIDAIYEKAGLKLRGES